MSQRYYLWISGCQMNSSDARRLGDQLEAAGMVAADGFDDADVAVLYTCSVRQSAENRVHGQLGHLKSLKSRHPDMVLCVTGCMAGGDTESLRGRYPFVDHFVSPPEMEELPGLLLSSAAARDCCVASDDTRYGGAVPVSVGVTVIRGCNKFCSYCIVPYKRGRQISRTEREIREEVEDLVSRGAREVVLLGQTVDAWGKDLDPPSSLGALLERLSEIPDLVRLRFLTSHPNDFTPDILDAMANLPKVCEEINLPVQAGDDELLRRMARPYSTEEYLTLIERIRGAIPGIALSTDLIVGFPGETAEQFDNSYALLERVQFDVVHVAAYSPRPGTAAARYLADDVPGEEKSRRLQMVEELQKRLSEERNRGMVGTDMELLVEGRSKGKWSGRTRTNKLVFFESDADLKGALVRVAIEKAGAWSMQGRLVL